MSNTEPAHYAPAANALHWLVAGLIVLQFVLAELAGDGIACQPLVFVCSVIRHADFRLVNVVGIGLLSQLV